MWRAYIILVYAGKIKPDLKSLRLDSSKGIWLVIVQSGIGTVVRGLGN